MPAPLEELIAAGRPAPLLPATTVRVLATSGDFDLAIDNSRSITISRALQPSARWLRRLSCPARSIDRDLVIEGPDELRGHVLALAQRLLASCGDEADASH